MRKLLTIIIIAVLPLFVAGQISTKPTVKPGIEVLKSQNFKILEGKRVGLITNPTGFDNSMNSTIDVLFEAPNVNLVALFGPEHGVRGDVHAGDKIESMKDPKTRLPVLSLYGATRKPTKEMLEGIDVLVYDIQDIGSRSFTYISTMGLAMEAAAENNIDFVVLDRPNPLGGLKIEGNLVEDGFFSFVSQFKIPYIYGLTCGELAMMLNGEGMLKGKCNLSVVPLEGWRRNMTFDQTGLQWAPSSPHIPQPISAVFYPVTGIVGELGFLSIGVGYTVPFQMFATEWMDADDLADRLNSYSLPGVYFRSIHVKPFYAIGVGKNLQGVQIHIMDYEKAALAEIQFYALQAIAELYPNQAVFSKEEYAGRHRMFDQVTGSDYIRKQFSVNHRFADIKDYWYKDVESFMELSKKYYLYD
jgi:Uncharacterized protein conserved in bacteria